MTGPDPQALRFQTTAKASADAHALARVGLAQFDLVIDGAALAFGLILLAAGDLLGIILVAMGVTWLVGSRLHPFQRALIAIRCRSILGRTTEVTVDDEGLHFENPLGSSFVPWSAVDAIRHNSQTVAFFRGHLLLGYVPSLAFASPEARAALVAFSQARITASQSPGRAAKVLSER